MDNTTDPTIEGLPADNNELIRHLEARAMCALEDLEALASAMREARECRHPQAKQVSVGDAIEFAETLRCAFSNLGCLLETLNDRLEKLIVESEGA